MSRNTIQYLPISEIKPYPHNPRKNEEAVVFVANSIEQFGFKSPIIIDKNNVIVCGHTRLLAAEKLGLNDVPCIVADDLTPEQIKAYRLADNMTASKSEWDIELLNTELLDLESNFDMSDFGFEIEPPTGEVRDDDFDADAVADAIVEPVTKLGDIWTLGRHRLMCGDSTDRETVDRLMDGAKADMVFTDPPYALFGNSTGVSGVADDKMTRPFFLALFQRAREITKVFGHIYACCDWHSAFSLQAMAKQAGLTEKNLCIWDKGNGGIGAMYQHCYEMIWFFANTPVAKTTIGQKYAGERTVNGKPNIWRYPREQGSVREHNAQKPLEMVKFAVDNSSDMGEKVCDLFGGSGTTLIACEETGRDCFMMELEPKYCDVIIKRWENLTGQKAVLNGEV